MICNKNNMLKHAFLNTTLLQVPKIRCTHILYLTDITTSVYNARERVRSQYLDDVVISEIVFNV